MPRRKRTCRVCGWKPAVARGLCGTDYRYWKRTGSLRSEDLVLRHAERVTERVAC